MRKGITLYCSECKKENYRTKKNTKNTPDKIKLKKFCYYCNSRTLHVEKKK